MNQTKKTKKKKKERKLGGSMSSHMLKYKTQTTQMLQLCVTILQGGWASVGAMAAGPGRGLPLLVAGSCFLLETGRS